jgi:V8-like Glu-specific endopeptidase
MGWAEMSKVVSGFFVLVVILAMSPGIVLAEGVRAHESVYTVNSIDQLKTGQAKAHALPKLVESSRQPMSALMRNNALPSQGSVSGTTVASSDGTRQSGPVESGRHADAYGSNSPQSIAPYTTAGAYAENTSSSSSAAAVAVTSSPWRSTGKLYFNISGKPYECTASLIAPGLVVTAAHCVFEFGTNASTGWHTDFVFVPAQADSNRPYGSWKATKEFVPTSYINGTDTCTQRGVVCNNDIALLVMTAQNGKLPGNIVGWYAYAWNGYSYVTSFGGASLAAITQLGYPEALDSGVRMERTDGIGSYWVSGKLKNTVLGSAQTGGSSGGPWLVNFGAKPTVGSGANLGSSSNANVVVGVTSWGYTAVGDNVQGASWFGADVEFPAGSYTDSKGVNRGAGNIGFLVREACNAAADHC